MFQWKTQRIFTTCSYYINENNVQVQVHHIILYKKFLLFVEPARIFLNYIFNTRPHSDVKPH